MYFQPTLSAFIFIFHNLAFIKLAGNVTFAFYVCSPGLCVAASAARRLPRVPRRRPRAVHVLRRARVP